MLTPQDLRHRLIRANATRRSQHHHNGIPRFVQEMLQKDAHRYQYTATPTNPPSFTYGADFETHYSSPINRDFKEQKTEDDRKFKKLKKLNNNLTKGSFLSRAWTQMKENRLGYRRSTKPAKHPPPSDLMRLFGETTLPGFRDIALSRNIIRRLFWIICFFFFSLWAVRDISQLISEYYEYPITVKVRLRENRQIQFPQVTICNLNIVRFSALCNKNTSKILYNMIPDDLRTKLCGAAPPVVKSVVNFTMPPIINAEPDTVGRKQKKTAESLPLRDEQFPVDINSYGDRASCNCTEHFNSTENVSPEVPSETTTTTTIPPETETQSEIPTRKEKRQVLNSSPFGQLLNAFGLVNGTPESPEPLEITEREEKELQENLTNWLAVIQHSNPPVAQHLGHQFEDFLLHCTFRFANCTDTNRFQHLFTPTEGNCFTFKPRWTGKRNRARTRKIMSETSIAGAHYGLELVLNFEIDEYLTGSTQIGAIVMVQHPDEIGISASEAIYVQPQQSTYIGLRMNNISRLGAPYPDACVNQWPDALVGKLTKNTTYSQQSCLKICLQKAIFNHCKCQSAMLPLLELESSGVKVCDTRRHWIRDCVDNVLYIAEERFGTCKCPARCQVINYDKTVSTARWPTREDRITFDRKRSVSFQNLAKVTIYFQTMTCQEVIQERAYTTARLFSALGGILGMYVGFSFLSVLEIFEVLFRRIWYAANHRSEEGPKNPNEQSTSGNRIADSSVHGTYDMNGIGHRPAYYNNYDDIYARNSRYRKHSFRNTVHAVVERLRFAPRNAQNGRF